MRNARIRFSKFEPKGRLKQQIQFQTKAAHRHAHIGSTPGKTSIRSRADTALKGMQLIGKGVQADKQLNG
nr:hemagglutinin repeat-containing protein [Neisseria benedictiae]